ncbi:hypothetical protein GCM10011579_095930 [Streptomyces albiflavescens]|uniref:Uncharacterized protein n=2 Tax=Streptomyces albiflavescens TaxID=1623582 RepID=A0A917YG27_9ACTN|nr:hypothetical protein GCM10011579_095930 [Streptomyces albiflavescens]
MLAASAALAAGGALLPSSAFAAPAAPHAGAVATVEASNQQHLPIGKDKNKVTISITTTKSVSSKVLDDGRVKITTTTTTITVKKNGKGQVISKKIEKKTVVKFVNTNNNNGNNNNGNGNGNGNGNNNGNGNDK